MFPTSVNLNYPEDFINKIVCGDCLELIKLIPDNSIDAIITDPPYGLNKNGVRNDADLSLFYNVLSECDRVLKDNSFFITFFSTKFCHAYSSTIHSIISGRLFYIILKEGLNLLSDTQNICLVLSLRKGILKLLAGTKIYLLIPQGKWLNLMRDI